MITESLGEGVAISVGAVEIFAVLPTGTFWIFVREFSSLGLQKVRASEDLEGIATDSWPIAVSVWCLLPCKKRVVETRIEY